MESISPTALDAFDCRLKWYLYRQRYKPIQISSPLELGLGIHKALEAYYGQNRDPIRVYKKWADDRIKEVDKREAPEEDLAKMADIRTLGIVMLEGYLEYWAKEKLEVIATERECRRPIKGPNGKVVDCDVFSRVDLIVREKKRDELFVMEHKTFSSFYPDFLSKNQQFVAEVYTANPLCKKLTGRNLSGLLYNGLRKQAPTSRVKNSLFERHFIYVSNHQTRVFLKRVYHTWLLMHPKNTKSGNPAIYPQPEQVRCSMCNYKDVCEQYTHGGDYRYVLDNFYTKEDK